MKKSYIFLLLILANLFWAGNYVFGKYIVAEISPLQMTFSRWLLALFLLFPIAHFLEHPNWKKVWKEWKLLFGMALLGIIGYNLLLYVALQYTSSVSASLVNALNPALIVLFSALLLREKIPPIVILGLVTSLAGALLVLTKGNFLDIFMISYNKGDLIMILAILVWTFYSLVGRKATSIPPITATTVSAFLAVLMLLPFILVTGLRIPFTAESISGILYIAIFPSAGSFICWNVALRYIDASKAGIYLNLIVVFTAIISVLLDKSITFEQIAGGVLVFIGVYLSSQKGSNNTINTLVEKQKASS